MGFHDQKKIMYSSFNIGKTKHMGCFQFAEKYAHDYKKKRCGWNNGLRGEMCRDVASKVG